MRLLLHLPILLLLHSCSSTEKIDLIVHNALIYTVNDSFSTAQAIAVKDGKIIATGSDKEILDAYSADDKIDAKGKAVYPGFIDAHAHFIGYGKSLFQVNLFGCNTWDEALERLKKFAAEHPDEQWITGRGWDQNKFPGKNYPDNIKLSELFPDKPVMLTRVDGHAAIGNKKAFEIAGITADKTIQGGEIEVKNGQTTGILVDNAVDLLTKHISGNDDHEKWLAAAEKKCFETGLTTITDCGIMHSDVDMLDKLQDGQV